MKTPKKAQPLRMRTMTNKEMGVLAGDGPDKKVERLSLMLHSCCGPCSSSVIERLAGEFNITVLYYNPCITDEEEYKRRRAAQVEFIEKFNAERIDLPDINLVEGPRRRTALRDMFPAEA